MFGNRRDNDQGSGHDEAWERNLISEIAQAAVVEQRRTRRWGIFFKLLFFTYLVVMSAVFLRSYLQLTGFTELGEHTAVVNVSGVIADGEDASAGIIVTGLREAFESVDAKGVILRINSPGGSPVQAGLVYDEIMRLRAEYPEKPMIAVIGDICASGGYYIAAAADSIYADKASIVGSIGVRTDSFGFVELMDKLGVERRLYTAGENKALLDPFSPQRPEEIAHLEGMLAQIHQQFIDAVKKGRGERLKDDPDLFTGLVWTGARSVELGLIDGLGGMRFVAEELIGAEELVDYTPQRGWLDRLLIQMGQQITSQFHDSLGRGVVLR